MSSSTFVGANKKKASAALPVLSERALNRALLARQLLLDRSPMTTGEALEHLVGMQSQVPAHPYIALWSRLARFTTDDLSAMMRDRSAARVPLMRGTIHLVTPRDALYLRPLTQPVYEKVFPGGGAVALNKAGLEHDALLAVMQERIEHAPATAAALGATLANEWPERDGKAIVDAVRRYLPLLPILQIPPRGVWGASHQPTWTTIERWLGQPLARDPSPDAAILRYLAAFGPATVADIQQWSRLTGLRPHVARLRPRLRAFRNERGQELFDVPGAPLPDPETPAPPRFLPGYDNALLSHADRARIISEERRRAIGSANGIFDATFLLDGFVAGTWRIERQQRAATIRLRPFAPLDPGDRAALAAEAMALLRFHEPDAADHDVRVVAPD